MEQEIAGLTPVFRDREIPPQSGPEPRPRRFAEANDGEIVQTVLQGDAAAYEEILRRYQGDVQRLSYYLVKNREDAEDLTQEIFVKVYRNLPRYDPARPFRSWLLTIATRECLSFLRKRRWRRKLMGRLRIWGSRDFKEPEHSPAVWDREHTRRRLAEAVEQLPDRARLVFILRYFHEWETKFIAEILGVSEVTVRRQCQIARRKLSERLKDLE